MHSLGRHGVWETSLLKTPTNYSPSLCQTAASPFHLRCCSAGDVQAGGEEGREREGV
ncbi:hypothetical protein C1H46_005323 [Malus baccata]|uniref:Uncharacterized protein n=1 Tax=Malus baccata TaxID=106549 RepID=A0A540NEJ5_MALBA|nr:hypothetical protein C1H46_005323 [Malus baccata]